MAKREMRVKQRAGVDIEKQSFSTGELNIPLPTPNYLCLQRESQTTTITSMAENIVTTSSYKPIFEMIERMPECTTADAYNIYYSSLDSRSLDPSIYLSMAITSGGYARDENLGFMEAMNKNGNYGSLIAASIVRQLEPDVGLDDIVVPSDLGKVPGWSQADYLLFWAHIITGLDPKEARKLDQSVHASGVMQLAGFHDKSIPRESRWDGYEKLIDTYADLFDNLRLGRGINGAKWPRNIQAVVPALDAQESLGVNAERYLCYKLGLGEYVCELDTDDAALVSATKEVRKLGATTLRLGFGNMSIISGKVNHEQHLALRKSGVRFRKSGIVSGVIYRKAAQADNFVVQKPESSEKSWREYYAAEYS